jgi:hypothetical protein
VKFSVEKLMVVDRPAGKIPEYSAIIQMVLSVTGALGSNAGYPSSKDYAALGDAGRIYVGCQRKCCARGSRLNGAFRSGAHTAPVP